MNKCIKIMMVAVFVAVVCLGDVWTDLCDPTKSVSIVNLTTNDISFVCIPDKQITFKAGSTTDVSTIMCREQLNGICIAVNRMILAGKMTNLSNRAGANVPVSSF